MKEFKESALGLTAEDFKFIQNIRSKNTLKQWMSGNPEKVTQTKEIVTASLNNIKNATSKISNVISSNTNKAIQKIQNEASKTRFKTFMPKVLTNLLDNITKAIKLTWDRSSVFMKEHPSIKYMGLAFLGATICLMLYKVIKWIRGTKQEKEVEQLQNNIFTFNKKLKEGFEFAKSLNNILKEAENSEFAMLNTIQKSKTAAEECGLFAIEAEEKTEGTSLIKKIAYTVLGGIAALAASLALYGYYSASPAEAASKRDWDLFNIGVTGRPF